MEKTTNNIYQLLDLPLFSVGKSDSLSLAYHRAIKKYPPETAPDEFLSLQAAYEILKDPQKRAEYDLFYTVKFDPEITLSAFLAEVKEPSSLTFEEVQVFLREYE